MQTSRKTKQKNKPKADGGPGGWAAGLVPCSPPRRFQQLFGQVWWGSREAAVLPLLRVMLSPGCGSVHTELGWQGWLPWLGVPMGQRALRGLRGVTVTENV